MPKVIYIMLPQYQHMKTTVTSVSEINVDIGISKNNLEKIITLLNHDLADEYILLTKTKKYHWNVVDP